MLFRSNLRCFLMALFNVSMSFYLFSYMSCEKDILYPLIPFVMLLYNYIHIFTTVIIFITFSNYYLFSSNGCNSQYCLIIIIYSCIGYTYQNEYIYSFKNLLNTDLLKTMRLIPWINSHKSILHVFTISFVLTFHLLEAIVSDEANKTFVFVNMMTSFLWCIGVLVYSYMLMYINVVNSEDKDMNLIYTLTRIKKKKRI